MSKLALHARPTVLFDPNNEVHRKYATDFVATGSWSDCPVRFTVEEDHGNLVGHIQRELILWYSLQEKDRDQRFGASLHDIKIAA